MRRGVIASCWGARALRVAGDRCAPFAYRESMTDFSIDEAAAALGEGRLVGVPTDTVYGIAADPFQQASLERLFEIKGRPGIKPIALLVASVDQGATLAAFSDLAQDLAARHWPGALTLILPRLDSTPAWLGDAARRTVGLRCPDHEVTLALLERVGPLAVTSANPAGQSAAVDADEAEALFGDEVAGYLAGQASGGVASTILDITAASPLLLRKGPVADPIDRR